MASSSSSLSLQKMGSSNRESEDGGSIFVGNLPIQAGENALRNLFSGFGKIQSARVLKHKDTRMSLGCGFVNFEHATQAAMAIQYMDGYRMDIGCWLRVSAAAPAPARQQYRPDIPASATLFVSGLLESMNKRRLMDLFCPFGKIDTNKTAVVRDKSTNKSKCCGFVSFETISDAEMARLVMNGYRIKGHNNKLRVVTKRQ